MNQKLLLLGIVLLILVGAGSFILGTKNSQPVNQTNSLSISPTTVQSNEISDPTANWKVHTSLLHKYTLKYPDNWETYVLGPLTELPDSVEEDPLIGSIERYFRPTGQVGGEIGLTISRKNTAYEILKKSLYEYWDNRSVVSTSIDGVTGLKATGMLKDKTNSVVLFDKGDWIYKIQTLGNDYTNVLNQILSTFKFTQ